MSGHTERRYYKDVHGCVYTTFHYPSGWVTAYQNGQRLFKVDMAHFDEYVHRRGDIRVGMTKKQKEEEAGQLFLMQ